jgi:hypothetical protein
MQLDKTRIGVRERGMLEVLDLSLHVLRAYIGPLTLTFLMGMAPLMLLNHLLIGWLADVNYNETFPFRYVWTMTLLVFIEAPLASLLATSYLGQSVFLERPNIWDVTKDVVKLAPRIVWCQLIVRGIAPACLLTLLMNDYSESTMFVEVMLLPGLALYSAILRCLRPFMNEIILLERNPLRAANSTTMTIGRRSSFLHGPSGGDLFVRGFCFMLVGVCLVYAVYGVATFLAAVLFDYWQQGPLMVQFVLPLSMWIVAFYFTVVRFLSYLDVRIRQEGWEVELRLRAEANRLVSKLT